MAPVLAGAGLVALPKPSGGVRPIAVGELLRRLTGKCLMALVREEASSHFWPAQAGVAVKGGAEKAVHAVRAWTQRHAGSRTEVVVKLDFSNAFNCVSRDAVLQQACQHFPALARWSYQQPTRLQFGERALDSCSGAQQGDPLGPLLFAAALQPLAAELRTGSLDIAVHYLDDGVLAGDLAAVGAALAQVEQRAAAIGLTLNLVRVLQHFEFLGAAIGDAGFVRAYTEQRVAKAATLLEALAELQDPQVARGCCVPARGTRAWCTACAATRRVLNALLWPLLMGWSDAASLASLASIRLRTSGNKLHSASPRLAWASAARFTWPLAELDASFSAEAVTAHADVAAALAALNAQLPGARALSLDAALGSKQRQLSERLDAAGWDACLLPASPTARAILFSEAGAGARAFLAALPSGRTRMEPAIFGAELRIRLGIPEAAADTWCPRCDGVLDCQGHHSAVCVAGGERTQRHNAVRDLVAFAPKRNAQACCFRRALTMFKLPGDGQPMFTSQLWAGLPLPLTLP